MKKRSFRLPSNVIVALGFALLVPSSFHAVNVKFIISSTFTPPAGVMLALLILYYSSQDMSQFER